MTTPSAAATIASRVCSHGNMVTDPPIAASHWIERARASTTGSVPSSTKSGATLSGNTALAITSTGADRSTAHAYQLAAALPVIRHATHHVRAAVVELSAMRSTTTPG